jgi:hypothetical protein
VGNFFEHSFSAKDIFREKILRENFGRKFRDRYAWSVVRIVSIHSSFTSSTGIDGIVSRRGSCEVAIRIKQG